MECTLKKILAFIFFFMLLPLAASGQGTIDLNNLYTFGRDADGKAVLLKCPRWDWSLIPSECKTPYMIAINCVPRCGKWPGDEPDIGAYEYVPGITAEQPWGDWNGIPLAQAPGQCTVPVGHLDYCRDCGPCAEGEGDCDTDAECLPGLYCKQVLNESDYCRPISNKPSIGIMAPVNFRIK